MASGLPGWATLIADMLRFYLLRSQSTEDLEGLIRNGNYILAATELRERMGEQAFSEFLHTHFRQVGCQPSPVHRLIVELPLAGIITTNYDDLLETAYAVSGATRPSVFTHLDTAALANAARDRRFFLLKLHGDADRPESVVLGRREYRELIFGNNACREFLTALLQFRTMLFVGFSLRDPDLLAAFDRLRVYFNLDYARCSLYSGRDTGLLRVGG